jgi:hypothetical protein
VSTRLIPPSLIERERIKGSHQVKREKTIQPELLSGPSRVSEHLEASGYVTDPLEPS